MGRLLVTAALLLAFCFRCSLAATITGTAGADRLVGTGDADLLRGLGGDDLLRAGDGRDTVQGGYGNDRVTAYADGVRDTIACGPGADLVNAELIDRVEPDCEVVSRQLSRDRLATFEGQHETQVEPDTFAFGSTVVTAFQVGRFLAGGAAAIGFATSTDGGRTWRSGILPGLTGVSEPAGTLGLASDPAVAYDAEHGVWLIATLGATFTRLELLVSRSADGVRWGLPVVAARAPRVGFDVPFDKEWLACDNGLASPFRGRCYLSYLDVAARQIVTQTSADGGLTWSGPVGHAAGPPSRAVVNGAQPVVQPDGTVVVVYVAQFGIRADEDMIAAVRSEDGGATFSAPVRVASLTTEDVIGVRAPPLPSVETDAAGRIYAAWADCRFSGGCTDNRIVLSTSPDGVRWFAPAPVGPPLPAHDAFVPGLGVDPATSGAKARLSVVYYTLPHGCAHAPDCPGVDVHLVSSANGGTTWSRLQRLNAESMPLEWIADSGTGRFLGDYLSTSYVNGRALPAFSLADEPVGDRHRQAIFVRAPRPRSS